MTGVRGGPVGITLRDLPGPPETVSGLIEAVLAQRVRLAHVPALTWFSPALDDEVLDAAAAALVGDDLTVAVGFGALNAHHLERTIAVARLGNGDPVAGWRRIIVAAARMGVTSLHFTIGVLDDRFDRATPWSDQLAASVALLRELAPVASDHGLPLVLKTHEEMTSTETVRLVEAVDPGSVRIGYSPVNVLTRLEDPVAAATRVAPYLHTLFLDDATVFWTPTGMARQMTAVGEGTVDWAGILDVLGGARSRVPIVLDLHRAELDMPFYQPGWTSDHPDMSAAELLAIASTAALSPPSSPVGLDHRREVGLERLQQLRSGTWPAVSPISAGNDLLASGAP